MKDLRIYHSILDNDQQTIDHVEKYAKIIREVNRFVEDRVFQLSNDGAKIYIFKPSFNLACVVIANDESVRTYHLQLTIGFEIQIIKDRLCDLILKTVDETYLNDPNYNIKLNYDFR